MNDGAELQEVERLLVRWGLPLVAIDPWRLLGRELMRRVLLIIPVLAGWVVLTLLGQLLNPFFRSLIPTTGPVGLTLNVLSWSLLAINFVVLALGLADTIRSWLRLGTSLSVMLGLVTFLFLSADPWRIFAAIDSSHLIVFATVGLALTVVAIFWRVRLFTDTVDRERLRNEVAFIRSFKLWGVSSQPDPTTWPRPTGLAGRARFNVRAILTLLLVRRVVISGLLVAMLLLLLGVLLLDKEATIRLVDSPENLGWALQWQSFVLSEALLKVALMLSSLSAIFFTLTTLAAEHDDRRGLTDNERTWLRQAIGLSSYYRAMVTAAFGRPRAGSDQVRPP